MNDVASPSALQILRLSGSKAAEMVAAPMAAFTRNVRCLRLRFHMEDRTFEEYVCAMLKRLQNLRTVRWELDEQPSIRVLETIGKLPHLEHIHLRGIGLEEGNKRYIGPPRPGRHVPHLAAYLAGLKTIVVSSDWSSLGTVSEVEKQLQLLLAANPRLERLELYDTYGPWINFLALIKGSLEAPNFQSSLRTLDLRSLDIPLEADMGEAAKYLANLSSLSIRNNELYHDALWRAFEEHRIKLEEVTVEEPTGPMVDYLQSYRGLKYICLTCIVPGSEWLGKEPVEEDVKNQLLDAALPHHSEYLRGIHIDYAQDGGLPEFCEPWVLDEDQLVWFQKFRKLDSVTVSCSRRERRERFITLQRALCGLLKELSPSVRSIRLAEERYFTFLDMGDSGEREELERLRFSEPIVDPHRKELIYLGFRWHLVRDSVDEPYRLFPALPEG